MNFGLLSTFTVLLGMLGLAIALWIAQRLRVQHREVEVLSTLFWQAAIEETRARVFVRRFRHWLAWMLLVAIASLLWMLLAQPTAQPIDGTRHVVLLDWSVDDSELRESDLQLAIDRAGSLPKSAREIIAVGSQLETLLAAGEPIELASVRASESDGMFPNGIHWALESLSFRGTAEHPLSLHLIGDVEIEKQYLDRLTPNVTVYRIPRESAETPTQLATLGMDDPRSGQWNAIDVAIAVATDQSMQPSDLQITIDDQPIEQPLQKRSDSNAEFQLLDVPANGGVLRVALDDETIGSMTLPTREPIRVVVDADVPATLRELIELDKACQIVESGGDVRVGSTGDANLRLTTEDRPAFWIASDDDDPDAALGELIDELALQQIDATAIAEQSGQMIEVQVVSAEARSMAIWNSLFTPAFDFAESRACPILVARSIRWLADRPPLVPWAEQGDHLPVAAPEFQRALGTVAVTDDERQIRTTRLSRPITESAELAESPASGLFARVGLYTWLGLIVSTLLAGEWMLYQRGRMP